MTLSKEERARIKDWLKNKWRECPNCRHGITDKLHWVIRDRHELAPSLPAVLIECPACSAILFVSYERAKN